MAEPSWKRPRNPDTLELYGIYRGRVGQVLDFGIRVELLLEKANITKEGMVYKAQLPNNYNKGDFRKGQLVWVKLISMAPAATTQQGQNQKLTLSIKDVDQQTGKDIMPHRTLAAAMNHTKEDVTTTQSALSSTAVVHPGLDVEAVKRKHAEEEATSRYLAQSMRQNNNNRNSTSSGAHGIAPPPRRTAVKQLTEQELFEAQQLVRSGVLPVEQYPTYDPELGMLAVEETEEETEVELADAEPAFLRGQTKRSGRKDLEPIKIVKNPDGSLQRAAMQQTSLAKERRELRQAQANQLIDSIPKDLNRPWEDPLPEAGERHFAQELRSINVMSQLDGAPEWKQKVQNKTLSYGIISNKSMTRFSLANRPTYNRQRSSIWPLVIRRLMSMLAYRG